MSLHDLARAGDAAGIASALAAAGPAKAADLVKARDHYSRTPLILAAWGGHADAVTALLRGGAAPTEAAKGDASALHFAAMRGSTPGHVAVAKALIDAGERGDGVEVVGFFFSILVAGSLSLTHTTNKRQAPAPTPRTRRAQLRSTSPRRAATSTWRAT